MKILVINKFQYPRGGAETYVIKLEATLQKMGQEVQYFGIEHPRRVVGNYAESYTSNMDFHGGSKFA